MPPSARPAPSSRRITRHQSESFTSPSASARITSVDACDPELPPLEMISGTNSARMTAFSISCSKKPIAVAVSISPRNSAVSQPARFWIMRAKPICMYGSSSASLPPKRWMSSVASASATSSTSSTVTMPIRTPAESVTGSAVRSSPRKTPTAVS